MIRHRGKKLLQLRKIFFPIFSLFFQERIQLKGLKKFFEKNKKNFLNFKKVLGIKGKTRIEFSNMTTTFEFILAF